MFKLLVVSIAITYCSAGYLHGGAGLGGAGLGLSGGLIGNGGGYGGYGLSLGGIGGGLSSGLTGLGGGNALSGDLAIAAPLAIHSPGPLSAAIQSHRTYEVIPVNLPQEQAIPQIIEVGPSEQPVQVIFRSVSSPVHVQQIHTPGAPGQVEQTHSEDEPHRVVHEVLRPVIQEVREVIQPYRRVTQEVRPVLEEVHTVVAKGEHRHNGLGLGGGVAVAHAPAIAADAGSLGLDLGSGGYSSGGAIGLSGNGYKSKAKKAA